MDLFFRWSTARFVPLPEDVRRHIYSFCNVTCTRCGLRVFRRDGSMDPINTLCVTLRYEGDLHVRLCMRCWASERA